MKLDGTFLRSKVARRVFVLFILCALLPITVLAIVSIGQVTRELQEQSQKGLHRASKAVGMSIYERLLLLDAELKLIAREAGTDEGRAERALAAFDQDLRARFEALVLVTGGEVIDVFGHVESLPELSALQREHLHEGKTLVTSQTRSGLPSRVFMTQALDQGAPEPSRLVGELKAAHLWGLGEQGALPAHTDMCVLDETYAVHVCSWEGAVPFKDRVAFNVTQSGSRYFEYDHDGTRYLASFWSIPLRFRFGSPTWTVVLSEPKAAALAPLANFKYMFSLVLLLSLWVVSLLSLVQIRRSLVPLEKLREGTRRISRKDFASRVSVESGDEFEELAASFNAMAATLGRQFTTLQTIAEIDRAVLSTLETSQVVATVLSRMGEVVPCELVGVTLRDPNVQDVGWMHVRTGRGPTDAVVEAVPLTLSVLQALHDHEESWTLREGELPEFLAPLGKQGAGGAILLPLFRAGRVSGFIALGYRTAPVLGEEELAQARQVADQVAAALANAEDVAERKRAETLLRDSNQRLEQALDELKATQRQMVQQERLRALGQMASGIAHDFNNTLSPIVGFSELLLLNPRNLDDKDKVTEHLKIINTAARDATKVVSHLRDFYRPRVQEDDAGAVDLNKLVEQTVRLTQPKWKDQALANGVTINVETDLEALPPVSGNESELREVLTNLVFNAVDAMERAGTITLRTRADEARVLLEVRDTGAGMSEEVRQRCLEPFFSTKGDRGTGLGLAMVYGIVRRHNGMVEIESEPGKGTRFILSLPVRTEGVALKAPEGETSWPHVRVLVVDDNELVRRVTAEYLRSLGHSVETADSGQDALEKFGAGGFGLVVTDQGMPGMSGEEVAAGIKRLAPGTPVIMLTGAGKFAETETEPDGSEAVDCVIHKPLTMASLQHALGKARARAASIGQGAPTGGPS